MAKKYAMRLNVYLDENEPKDKIIIDFLTKKYSEVGFIKETMYTLAIGSVVQNIVIQSNTNELLVDKMLEPEQEYEPIKDAGDIEL